MRILLIGLAPFDNTGIAATHPFRDQWLGQDAHLTEDPDQVKLFWGEQKISECKKFAQKCGFLVLTDTQLLVLGLSITLLLLCLTTHLL